MKPVIIGAGLAGLTTALSMAPMPVLLLSPNKMGTECASAWAQGGIAAAIGQDDNARIHAEDTCAAGANLCDTEIVQTVTNDGINIVEFLLSNKVPFDRDASGQLQLGLEAAHRRRRIVHAADQTGAAITHALISAAYKTSSIDIMEEAFVQKIHTESNTVTGVSISYNDGIFFIPTSQVILATGGAGALWQETSNPLSSWGSGLVLAAKAGAVLRDLEFMQFHPTAIDIGRDPMPLASEALRGEGCTLINEKGERFVEELQPRDVVARAIWAQRAAGKKVFLDARTALGKNFAEHFPAIYASCMSAGIDPCTAPIPVSPAAHYHMGGVATDVNGRTNVEGLWACGEVANTGLHGANRLASNSLLEAASFGMRVAKDVAGQTARELSPQDQTLNHAVGNIHNAKLIRSIMSKHVGVLRNAHGLNAACEQLAVLAPNSNMATIALMIAMSALRREESRGSHTRTDFPETRDEWQRHQTISIADIEKTFDPTEQRSITGA